MGGASAGDDRQDPAFSQFTTVVVGVVALVAEQSLGGRRGRPGRPATGGMLSTRARGWVTSLTLAAVVMTLSGVPWPSQIKWCLLPVLRRSTGDGPVSAPRFWRGRGSPPRRPWTSPARRPRSAWRAGFGAAGRRSRPSAAAQAAASRSGPSRTPAPAAAVARRCRACSTYRMPCRHCPSGTGRGPGAFSGQGGRSGSINATGHRPRSTAEYSPPPNG